MMGQQRFYQLILCAIFAALAACESTRLPAEEPKPQSAVPAITECQDPRPELCAEIYQPVCALRDTGIRCVKAPCDEATEWRTYANACNACSDKRAMGYREGECE